jgi:PAS domain S-box-containing protein
VSPDRADGISLDDRPELRKLLGITNGLSGPLDSGSPTSLSVLLVHSDAKDSQTIIERLQRAGFTVQANFASSRYEFAVKARALPYDLIISDYALGDWSAMDLLADLRTMSVDTPLIVTAAVTDERAAQCVIAGAVDYVTWQNLKRLPLAVGRALGEKKLREDRAQTDQLVKKLSLAVDQSPASVIFTDLTGSIQFVNRRFTEVTGYSLAEALGRSPRMLNSGRNSRELYGDMWKTIRAGEVWRGELINRRKNGETYWDSVSISPIRDANGVVTHFLGCQEDITKRKNDEQRVRESEARFRQLASNMHEVFFVASASLREMQYVSPGYEEIWGRSCQSLYENPQSFIDGVPQEDREALFAHVAQAQRGETPPPVEYRVVRPDGTVRWVLNHSAPIKDSDGVVYRMSGTALDVTDRHHAEEALRRSELRFRLLTQASFDGIVSSVDGIVTEANDGFAKMMGYSVDEVIGQPIASFVHEESQALVEDRIRHGLVGIYEFVGKHRTGRKLKLEAAAKSDEMDGQLTRITAIRDVTGTRLLEDQFRQAQKMEAVGRLAGGVAHDFNNLLTVIMTYTQMLTEDLGRDSRHQDDLEEIQKASTAAASLTRQLLAFSRQQVIEPKLISLNEIVQSAEKMLSRLIGEDVEFVAKLGADACPVVIDPGQLEQVIMNLAVNARDAMPVGGKLTVETAIVDLDDTYAQNHWPAVGGRFAMLAVSDTGCGMTEAVRTRIFEPFFTTKEVGKGTGLGLAMVYGIVKQSNGFIWVYSEPDAGTTFKLYFPLAAQKPATEQLTLEKSNGRGTETILLVEDSSPVRAAAKRILEVHGYHVLEAPTGKAALALAAKKQHDIKLLLTDVVMPNLNGREVAEQFSGLLPDARVVFMSGYTNDAVVLHGILERGVAYLQKPFTGDALAEKIRAVLDAPLPANQGHSSND